ncbi:MAG: hypothetical protein IPI45_00650 [Saprospiraceae bacterium]|nr:hypothetical protein [Saprospiraceae bacterium]MBK7736265.1 hypothetical protein [Saprospiraceae bacterium]MBK7912369.1 hypothetical protein [Saprospiraceae bacterium]
MAFILKLIYYCLLAGTAALSFFYIWTALFSKPGTNNPFYLKQWFGIVSLFVLAILYKAYLAGEVEARFGLGIKIIMISWALWGLIVILFYGIAKYLGKI